MCLGEGVFSLVRAISHVLVSALHPKLALAAPDDPQVYGIYLVLSISKSVEPNEEQKEMISGFQQGILCKY